MILLLCAFASYLHTEMKQMYWAGGGNLGAEGKKEKKKKWNEGEAWRRKVLNKKK